MDLPTMLILKYVQSYFHNSTAPQMCVMKFWSNPQ
jgi:hypothetical protein